MAVRRTETVIPGGFARADRLGFAQVSPDRKFALVSYLGEDWPMGRTETAPAHWFSIPNRYVLFVDTEDLEWVNHYRWEVTALDRSGRTVRPESKTEITTQIGVFNLVLGPEDVAELIHNYANTLLVSVEPYDADGNSLGEPLVLVHQIQPLDELLEAHLASSQGEGNKDKDSGKGNETSTRIVGNYLASLIHAACAELDASTEAVQRTKFLLTAAVYRGTVRYHENWQRSFENSGLRNYLNGIFRFRIGFSQPTGICGLLPYHFQRQTKAADDVVLAPINTATAKDEDTYARRHFNGLTRTDQIEIYNLLRFPLAQVRMLAELLTGELLAERPTWLPKGWDKIEKIRASRYVKALGYLIAGEAELPEFRVFPIQVRDIRSGMPIRHAAVSRLEIIGKRDDPSATLSFDFDTSSRRFEVRDLDKLYDRVLSQYEQSSDDYWKERQLPKDSNKRYAVREYLAHSRADSSGTVEVMVPQAFLDAHTELSIRIGFHYFPIINNEWKTGDEVAVTSEGTGLKVVWIGDEAPGLGGVNHTQSTDWSENLDGGRHFGWAARHPRADNAYPLRVGVGFTVRKEGVDQATSLGVYGMQWCQPVWAVVPESATHYVVGKVKPSSNYKKRVVHSTAIPLELPDRTNPFLVTRWNSGSDGSHGRGRDYGCKVIKPKEVVEGEKSHPQQMFTKWEEGIPSGLFYPPGTAPRIAGGNQTHHGLDYYAVEGVSKVFAFRAGKIGLSDKVNGYGYCVAIESKGSEFTTLYAHLDTPSSLEKKIKVMAGTFLGTAGRSYFKKDKKGIVQPKYEAGPTHLHVEVRQSKGVIGGKRYADPLEVIARDDPRHYPANRKLLLNNDSPRLFPCDCHGGTIKIKKVREDEEGKKHEEIEEHMGSGCIIRGNDKSIVVARECWASRNLHCPYLASHSDDTYLVQAQLGWIPKEAGIQPDGDWGKKSKAAIRAFRMEHLADEFAGKEATDLEAFPEKGSSTRKKLDELAPYPRTDFTKPER